MMWPVLTVTVLLAACRTAGGLIVGTPLRPTVSTFRPVQRSGLPGRRMPVVACASSGTGSDDSSQVPDAVSAADLQRRLDAMRAERQEEVVEQQTMADVANDAYMASYEAARKEQRELRKRLKRAFVLIFNAGQESEGIYTLFIQGKNVVLAFEDKTEAVRYALMLKAQEFFSPTPQEMETQELTMFCKSVDIGLQLVPTGRGLLPPESNKPDLEYDPANPVKQQRGERRGPARIVNGQRQARGEQGEDGRIFTPTELEDIKRNFNKLYETGSGL